MFKELPWDTAYFGVRSARLTLAASLSEAQMAEALASADQYEFVCIQNKDCDVENARNIGRMTNAFVADTNVRFEKRIVPSRVQAGEPGLAARGCCPPDQGVLHIAATAYRWSRFTSDRVLKAKKGALVYHEWAKNAFLKPDKFFLISRAAADGTEREPPTNGFILFSAADGCLTLELIGVAEGCQGEGIGRKLWIALENEAVKRNCAQIAVGTQLQNLDAIRFYSKMGCVMCETNQIYHWWRTGAGA